MKKTELLLDVIGEAKDEYLQEIDSRMERVRHRRMWKRGILAACLILIFGVAVQFGVVFGGGFGANCSYGPQGISAGGYFYYELPGDGFFRYSIEDDDEVSADDLNSPSIKEESTRLTGGCIIDRMKNTWYSFTANDYGFYYTKGNWIYRIRHGETKSEKLYRYEGRVSVPYMFPAGANDIAVEVGYEGENVGLHNELFIIDGITGDRKTTIIDEYINEEEIDAIRGVLTSQEPGTDDYNKASDQLNSHTPAFAQKVTYTVGDRTLELILKEGTNLFDYAYRLTENGKELTEFDVEPYDVRTVGDSLSFAIGRDGNGVRDYDRDSLIVRPDGTQYRVFASAQCGRDYCLNYTQGYVVTEGGGEQTISATRLSDGKRFYLKWDTPTQWFYGICSDGKYLWATFGDRIACYRIEYQNDIPSSLTLLNDDITHQ